SEPAHIRELAPERDRRDLLLHGAVDHSDEILAEVGPLERRLDPDRALEPRRRERDATARRPDVAIELPSSAAALTAYGELLDVVGPRRVGFRRKERVGLPFASEVSLERERGGVVAVHEQARKQVAVERARRHQLEGASHE